MNNLLSTLLKFILWILFPKRNDRPDIPNLKDAKDGNLQDENLPYGSVIAGDHGQGKTVFLAQHRVEYDLRHLDHPSFTLDPSGSYTDDYLGYAQSFPPQQWQALKEKIRYIRLGDPNWVSPMPEFSSAYNTSFEEQIYRAIKNVRNLTDHMERDIHVLGGQAILPHLFNLLVALRSITPDHEPFSITDAPLLLDYKKWLSAAIAKCGNSLNPISREFLMTRLLNVDKGETELRTYALNNFFSMLSTVEARAALGGGKPVFTIQEAFENGYKVIIDGSRLINQQDLLNYLFTQYFSLIMEQFNRRTPHDPKDKPAAVVVDELKKLYKSRWLAEEIGESAPLYRSRGLQAYLVLQSYSQLSPELEEAIWLFLNKVTFRMSNKENDASRTEFELFHYNPKAEKLPAVTETQNQVSEPEKGQDRQNTDWLTTLPQRACVVKHANSSTVYYVAKTKEVPALPEMEVLEELKQDLLRQTTIPLAQALQIANERVEILTQEESTPPRVRGQRHVTN